MDDAALWTDYLSYLRRAPDASGPAAFFEGYRHDLSAAGVAPDVVAARLTRLAQLSLERSDSAAPMYDRIYTYDRPQFSLAPNEFLVRIAGELPAGRALDVAMGQGRNTIYLARAETPAPHGLGPRLWLRPTVEDRLDVLGPSYRHLPSADRHAWRRASPRLPRPRREHRPAGEEDRRWYSQTRDDMSYHALKVCSGTRCGRTAPRR